MPVIVQPFPPPPPVVQHALEQLDALRRGDRTQLARSGDDAALAVVVSAFLRPLLLTRSLLKSVRCDR